MLDRVGPESALNVPRMVLGITIVLKSLAVKRKMVYRYLLRALAVELIDLSFVPCLDGTSLPFNCFGIVLASSLCFGTNTFLTLCPEDELMKEYTKFFVR